MTHSHWLRTLHKDESGSIAVEYLIVLATVILLLASLALKVGQNVLELFEFGSRVIALPF